MKDLFHNLLVTQHLAPVLSTAVKTSTTIDLQAFEGAVVAFAVGQSADALSESVYWTLKLQHSGNDSDYTDVSAADLHNGAASVVIDSTAEDEVVHAFGYKGSKRYLKAVATPTGSHSGGTPIGIFALRGLPAKAPVA